MRMSRGVSLACALAVSACGDREAAPPEAAQTPAAGEAPVGPISSRSQTVTEGISLPPAAEGDLDFALPAGWQSQPPTSSMRVAQAATKGLAPALGMAVRAGAVNGFAVVGLGILGLSGFYLYWRGAGLHPEKIPILLIGFAFGGSLMSLFARVGGGIFTKAADVGATVRT